MYTINAISYFPYNWYELRSLRIKGNGNILLEKLKTAEETDIKVSDDIQNMRFQIDFYKATVSREELIDHPYVLIFFETRKILGSIKPKGLRVKCFSNIADRSEFANTLYQETKSKAVKKNIPNNLLATFIAIFLISLSFLFEKNPVVKLIGDNDINLVLIIGIISLISLLLIRKEKEISLYNYKSRMIATVIAYILCAFYISSNTILIILSVLICALLVRLLVEFRNLESNRIS